LKLRHTVLFSVVTTRVIVHTRRTQLVNAKLSAGDAAF